MNWLIDRFFRLLELLMVLLLAGMAIMVFGNAVLRKLADYGPVILGGGIDVSEELSRMFFIWLTFIGAVVVAREGAHLGVNSLVERFGPLGRKICMGLSDGLVLLCCLVFFWGSLRQAPLHLSNHAPISGLSMLFVYGIGLFTAAGIGAITAARLLRLLTGHLRPDELRAFAGEDLGHEAQSIRGHLE
jgi:TRAP-type transport system small permease protein